MTLKLNKEKISIAVILLIVFAIIGGFLLFQNQVPDTENTIRSLITDFFKALSDGNLTQARAFLTESKRSSLLNPYTALSEAVYREFKLLSVGNIFQDANGIWFADVNLSTLDTMQIMVKADTLFNEKLALDPTLDETAQDEALEAIYEELLAREDLPKKDQLLILMLKEENGTLRIDPDETAQAILSGNISDNLSAIKALMQMVETGF